MATTFVGIDECTLARSADANAVGAIAAIEGVADVDGRNCVSVGGNAVPPAVPVDAVPLGRLVFL